MTVHEFPSGHPSPADPGPPSYPSRSGEPWTEDDYENLMRLCREGAEADQIALQLGRGVEPMLTRAKRLLPIDQRGMPNEQILAHLRRCLSEDADYDWQIHLAASPPPRPIVNHVLPQPKYSGISGLEYDELLAVAVAFAAAPARPASRAVADKVARELRNRHRMDSYDFREAAARAVLKHLAGDQDEEIPYWAYDHTSRY